MYICFYIHNWFGQIIGIALTCSLNFTSVQNWYNNVESSLYQLVVKYYKNRKNFHKRQPKISSKWSNFWTSSSCYLNGCFLFQPRCKKQAHVSTYIHPNSKTDRNVIKVTWTGRFIICFTKTFFWWIVTVKCKTINFQD